MDYKFDVDSRHSNRGCKILFGDVSNQQSIESRFIRGRCQTNIGKRHSHRSVSTLFADSHFETISEVAVYLCAFVSERLFRWHRLLTAGSRPVSTYICLKYGIIFFKKNKFLSTHFSWYVTNFTKTVHRAELKTRRFSKNTLKWIKYMPNNVVEPWWVEPLQL